MSRNEPTEGGTQGDGDDDSAPMGHQHPESSGGEFEEFEELLDQLRELEQTVDDRDEQAQVRETMRALHRIPGRTFVSRRISKYTTRDVAETVVGGILLSLPMLVEDGVFLIAEWFLSTWIVGIPVFLVTNILFIVLLTIGLVYWSDIREVTVTAPLLGFIPRRLVGTLVVTFITATGLFVMWGRHTVGDQSTMLALFSQITVVWAAAAFGGALGDILPGESKGHDIRVENFDEIVTPGE